MDECWWLWGGNGCTGKLYILGNIFAVFLVFYFYIYALKFNFYREEDDHHGGNTLLKR